MATTAKDIQLRELKDTVIQLNETIRSQTELIKSLQKTIDQNSTAYSKLQEEFRVLKEQNDFLMKKLFGKSSEKRVLDIPGQLNLFNEAEVEAAQSPEEEPEERVVKTRKKKPSQKNQFSGIPVRKVVIPLDPEKQICPECGAQMELIGEEYSRREVIFIPAKCEVIEYYTQSYRCPNCGDGTDGSETSVIVKSNAPEALIPHSPVSSSIVAWAMYQKFVNSVPFYRQEKDWRQYGAPFSRATLAHITIKCAERYFRPLYDYFHRELLKRSFAMADETRIQVLHEENRRPETQSFMWLFRSGEDGLPTIILYGYTQTRHGDHAADFLKGFTGYLETDGYQGYNKVSGVKRCSCWAHIRRYFIDAVPKGKAFDYSQPAVQGVQYCDRLFRLEDYVNSHFPGNYEKRKQYRLEKEKPVLEAFWSWLNQLTPVRNSRLDKAVTYVKNQWPGAQTYLEDGRCSFTNNLSENAIRPFTVGRKNWLFSDTVAGAEASSVVYTMVEMAKAHGLNIYDYLKFVLDNRPDENWSDEQLETLAPWNEAVGYLKNRM